MVITIMDNDKRFGVRVAAFILNKDKTKIFMQRQRNYDYYMFPGGRLELGEDSSTAIIRELEEELGIINEDVKLKYIVENYIDLKKIKYHEIGFYFIVIIDENKYEYYDDIEYNSKDEEHDGISKFRWIKLDELNNFKFMPDNMKEYINSGLLLDGVQHISFMNN